MADIESLSARRPNAMADAMTPMESLIDAMAEIQSGEMKPVKAIVILIEDDGESFRWRRRIAGMKKAEIIGTLTTILHDIMHEAD